MARSHRTRSHRTEPTERYVVRDDLAAWRGQMLDTLDLVNPISITNNQYPITKNMPRPLPPSKPIEHLFFYKNFICLVYSDQTKAALQYPRRGQRLGWQRRRPGESRQRCRSPKQKHRSLGRSRAILKPLIVLVIGAKTHCQLPIANYPSCEKSPLTFRSGAFLFGTIGLLIFCCFQNFPKLRHSIFG